MPSTRHIIAIAGASGSGKTHLAGQLCRALESELGAGAVALIEEDAYYATPPAGIARERVNYDHPSAFDHALLCDHLRRLRAGQAVSVPRYDFAAHARRADCRRVEPAEVVVIEGIMLLADAARDGPDGPALHQLFDLRLFIDTPLDICLGRRIRRDLRERGRSLESVLNQYEAFVRPMYLKHIEPSRARADLIVPGGGSPDGRSPAALGVIETHIRSLLQA